MNYVIYTYHYSNLNGQSWAMNIFNCTGKGVTWTRMQYYNNLYVYTRPVL